MLFLSYFYTLMAAAINPFVPEDVSGLTLRMRKTIWSLQGHIGPRRIMKTLFPAPSISFFDMKQHPGVQGYVGLTIDDAFCSPDRTPSSMMGDIRRLLEKAEAKATFFAMLQGFQFLDHPSVQELLGDGHEMGNHCVADKPYDKTSEFGFEAALEKTGESIEALQGFRTPWFRAPHGKLSAVMKRVLERHGLINIMVDCYANDPFIPDSRYLADFILRYVEDGSIVLLHMPERGFREWNYDALARVLEGLRQKGLKPVTISELYGRAAA